MNSLLILAAVVLTKPVTGSVQFWDRPCNATGHCVLPSPLSEKLPVEGEVSEPAGPGQLGSFRQVVTSGELAVDFQVFWVAPPDGSLGYWVSQARLSEGQRLVTECTQYNDLSRPVFFPVGACSGFSPQDGGGSRQVGVTFYKTP